MFSDLNDIRLFAEVVRQRSVTKGAIALGMPAATVSRRLAALEKEFGVRLVERSARRFDLTEAGAACHRVAQRAMEGLEQAKHELEGVISRPLGHLRLTAPPDFATAFLAEPLVAFAAQYPDISISLDVSSRRVSLVDENFDIVIRMGRLDDSLHVSQRLMALSRGLYASREWSTRVTLPDDPAALSNAQCVTLEAYSTHGELALQRIDRPSVKRVVPVHERMSVNSMPMLRQLLYAGAGIGLVPNRLMQADLATGRVIRVLPQWEASPVEAHILYRDRVLLPLRARLLIDHLRATLQDL